MSFFMNCTWEHLDFKTPLSYNTSCLLVIPSTLLYAYYMTFREKGTAEIM